MQPFVRFVLFGKLLLMKKAKMAGHSMGRMGHGATTGMPGEGLEDTAIRVYGLGCLTEGLQLCRAG